MAKLITVLGATGGQGGSVARSLLANTSQAFKVRAITRNPGSGAAEALIAAGADVMKADALNKESIAAAFEGSWGSFININSDDPALQVKDGPTETVMGKLILDAAFEAGVKHVVYSGLASATEVSNGEVPNLAFDEKHAIYQYGKSKGFASFTAAAPGEYMENFTVEAIAPVFGGFPFKVDEEGFLTYRAPSWGGSGEIPYLGLGDDYGDIVHGLFLSPGDYDGEFVQAFSNSTHPQDVTATYEKVTGKRSRYQVLPRWQDLETLGLTVLETVKRMYGFCQASGGLYYGSPNDTSKAGKLKAVGAGARGMTGDRLELITFKGFFEAHFSK